MFSPVGFSPENKGKPARVGIYQYPNHTTPITSKSFYQAEEVTVRWSPSGESAIVFTSTSLDTTGKSYYGSTGLHLLSADNSHEDCTVPLPKEGPVHDVQWCPNKTKDMFIVVSGNSPAQAALYNGKKCEKTFLFGENPRNTIVWAPHGRFVALAGFGNLAGDIDFWDMNKKKKMGQVNAHGCAFPCWSDDSRKFMVSTCSPRMNVDNGFKVFKYNGVLVKDVRRDVLYEAKWKPEGKVEYPDRAQSPVRKGGEEVESAGAGAGIAAQAVGKYRPPGAYR